MINFHESIVSIKSDVIGYRRHLHENPEVGFETAETEKFVRRILDKEGIGTLPSTVGVIGLIRAASGTDAYVALRADMDALSMEEANDVPYRSKNPGKMHACGHDGHTAMLLGAARVINSMKQQLKCNVLLIFQPAEEGPNLGGARIMIKDLDAQGLTPKIRAIGALHLSTEYPVGSFAVRYGSTMASTDEFDVTITGVGGHCGIRQKAIDPLSIGAKFITGMESYLSRFLDPFDPAIFAVGTFHSGSARNIIPNTAELSGTLRAQSEENREKILKAAEEMLQGFALYTKADIKIDIRRGLPVLVNDDHVTKKAEQIATSIVGAQNILTLKHSNMGAEDFAYLAQKIPAAFIWVGARNEAKGFVHIMHNPKFDIDEDALALGTEFLCKFAFESVD